MYITQMIHYARILQTGIQSLLAVACGWGCGRWGVVDAEPTVQYTNTLVLKFCIPCLQIWLLAVKTDMQQADNWRALLAFLLWSLGLQALLGLHQLLTKQRLQLDRLGVDGLILTTNNTGILGPVVLEAAVGAQYAPLGMLATVALYFQQLPLAQLLFQLHQQQQQQPHHQQAGAVAFNAMDVAEPLGLQNGCSKLAPSPEPCSCEDVSAHAGGCDASSRSGQLRHLHHMAQAPHSTQTGLRIDEHAQPAQHAQHGHSSSPSRQTDLAHVTGMAASSQHRSGFGSTGALAPKGRQQARRLSWDLEHQQQGGLHPTAAAAAAGDGRECQPLLIPGNSALSQHQQQHVSSYVLYLLFKNPLVWSTAIAVMLSACGSAALLDPSSPLAIKHLAFVEALLGWFAQTTAPLTLFTTGLWMYSNQQQQQQQGMRQAGASGACITLGTDSAAGAAGGVGLEAYGSRDVAWRDVWVYLALRAALAPAFMVLVCRLLGFTGDLAHALVILALLPVAQTAFVVCKQADIGMAAVSLMLVASLFMMLPQLMVVLALLERLGVFSGNR